MVRMFAILTVSLMAGAALGAPKVVDRLRNDSAYLSELGRLAAKQGTNVNVRALGERVATDLAAQGAGGAASADERKALKQLSALHGSNFDDAFLDELQFRCEDLMPAMLDARAHGEDNPALHQTEGKMAWCASEVIRVRGDLAMPPPVPPSPATPPPVPPPPSAPP
jgi:hypothetical protein